MLDLVPSTADEARRRADRIRGHVASAWEEVITAYKHRDHEALGYGKGQAGWDAYILGEYGESRLTLPRAERVQHVIEASHAGMSPNAIATAAGVHRRTVQRDIDQGAQNAHPDLASTIPVFENGNVVEHSSEDLTPDPLDAVDCTHSARLGPNEKIPTPPEALSTAHMKAHQEWEANPRKVTGVDGKTYTVADRPEPKDREEPHQPPRKPIKRQFFETVSDLTKAVKRLDSLTIDDRFPSAAQDLGISNKSDIDRAIQLLTKISTQLEYNI